MEANDGQDLKILVVDDEEFVIQVTKQIMGLIEVGGTKAVDMCCFV